MATITVGCPVCEDSFELDVLYQPGYPPHISAHPENDYPGEGPSAELAEVVPTVCPACKHEWTPEEMKEVEQCVDKALDIYTPEPYDYNGPDTLDEEDR